MSTDDRQEMTLRAAASIKALLDDGEAHQWRDCIDLAREQTGGHKALAQRLAWRALTEYLDDALRLLWGGEKGARWLAIWDAAKVNQAVCPACGSEPGEPCVRLNGKGRTSTVKSWPHDERQLAAYVEPIAAEDVEHATTVVTAPNT